MSSTMSTFTTSFIKRIFYGPQTTIATLNFGGGINGTADEASPTEFVTSPESARLHDILYELQKTAMLADYPGIKRCVDSAFISSDTSSDLLELLTAFLEHSGNEPMFDFITASHLKADNKKNRPPYTYGSNPDVTTPISTLYDIHCSNEVLKQYVGEFAPLWIYDLMGIWFREADLDTFSKIIDESPLVGVSSLMTTDILLNSVSNADFIMAQEFPRGDNIDDLVRRLGWSVMRNGESTAFLYKTANVVSNRHPMPEFYNDARKRHFPILSPCEFYDDEDNALRFNTKDPDSKKAKTAKAELEIIEKAERRTLLVSVGMTRFAVIHWTQPKSDAGWDFQQAYFNYLVNMGFIVAGDTNTSAKKIRTLMDKMGLCLLGEDPTEPTSEKMRTKLGTHGQYLRPEKAGIMVADPKSHFMVPKYIFYLHHGTDIVSNGPVGTKQWPSDHKGKISTFRGIRFI